MTRINFFKVTVNLGWLTHGRTYRRTASCPRRRDRDTARTFCSRCTATRRTGCAGPCPVSSLCRMDELKYEKAVQDSIKSARSTGVKKKIHVQLDRYYWSIYRFRCTYHTGSISHSCYAYSALSDTFCTLVSRRPSNSRSPCPPRPWSTEILPCPACPRWRMNYPGEIISFLVLFHLICTIH